jgi:hypothetical protein
MGAEGSGEPEQSRGAEGRGEGGKASEQLNQSSPSPTTHGGFDPVSRAILLGDKSDFTAFAHESAHWYLSVLSELSQGDNAQGWIKRAYVSVYDNIGAIDKKQYGVDLFLRACLRSSEQQPEESQVDHLQAGIQLAFAVLP